MDTFGDSTDPTLLLIHGAGNTRFSWEDEFCARLAAGGRHVIRYDLDARASLRELVDDAVDRLGDRPGHVVGLSLGGMIGQRLALDHPARVASLVLASTTPGGDGLPRPADGLFEDEPEAPDWSDRDAVIEYLVAVERPFSPHFDEDAARAIATRVVDSGADVQAALEHFTLDMGEPWRARLGEVRVPVLVIHGSEDPVFPPAHGRALADEIPGATLLVLEGVGHEYFPRSSWDVVVPAILRHTV